MALVRPRVAGWRRIWDQSVAAETRATAAVLDAMERGDATHLRRTWLLGSQQSACPRRGMCGLLRTHDVAAPDVLARPAP